MVPELVNVGCPKTKLPDYNKDTNDSMLNSSC